MRLIALVVFGSALVPAPIVAGYPSVPVTNGGGLPVQPAGHHHNLGRLIAQMRIKTLVCRIVGAHHEMHLRNVALTQPRLAGFHHLPPQPAAAAPLRNGEVVHQAAMSVMADHCGRGKAGVSLAARTFEVGPAKARSQSATASFQGRVSPVSVQSATASLTRSLDNGAIFTRAIVGRRPRARPMASPQR